MTEAIGTHTEKKSINDFMNIDQNQEDQNISPEILKFIIDTYLPKTSILVFPSCNELSNKITPESIPSEIRPTLCSYSNGQLEKINSNDNFQTLYRTVLPITKISALKIELEYKTFLDLIKDFKKKNQQQHLINETILKCLFCIVNYYELQNPMLFYKRQCDKLESITDKLTEEIKLFTTNYKPTDNVLAHKQEINFIKKMLKYESETKLKHKQIILKMLKCNGYNNCIWNIHEKYFKAYGYRIDVVNEIIQGFVNKKIYLGDTLILYPDFWQLRAKVGNEEMLNLFDPVEIEGIKYIFTGNLLKNINPLEGGELEEYLNIKNIFDPTKI
jgi:hypothetical protein